MLSQKYDSVSVSVVSEKGFVRLEFMRYGVRLILKHKFFPNQT